MIDQNVPEFEKMNLNKWHAAGYKGKGSSVVVLDVAGVPHDFTNVIEPIPSTYQKIGHQTNVCSVVREIAPEATIYSFHWSSGFKDEINNWIKEHQEEIAFINFSVSGMSVRDEFKELESLNIPVVVASGNSGNTDRLNPYAELDWTVAVGAWNEIRDSAVGYSNAGANLDIVAYTNIYIPSSDGYDRVFGFNGTSCSAPVVCGLLAVYDGFLKQNGLKGLDRQSAMEFLMANSIDKLETGHDFKSGHGLAVLPKDIPQIEIEKPIPPVVEKPIEEEVGIVPELNDIKGHWAEQYIQYVVDKGWMKGYEEGVVGPEDDVFRPDKALTRAEFAAVVARMDGFVPKK